MTFKGPDFRTSNFELIMWRNTIRWSLSASYISKV